ncbi:glycosyltransferase family 2 protein [Helicobacter marmotae]|uniref:Glycosyltransferase n=1 Tax=Helicobacter marmotae TaxID=152490 RepID=A0A3D8I588_9HELI|nr:glycosyltransferase family 2 protein [Helicobacter marmotae]RDU60176.1 glycosyltransferase [Helicobacter marmotae]
MRVCIVIPAHNEEAVLEMTYKELQKVFIDLLGKGEIAKDSFLCFVDDGSKDSTWEILTHLASNTHIRTTALKLSRNFGHQNALLAGLEYVADKCDYALSIDCDLQDDILAIYEFIAKAKAGAEVILGVRKSRKKDSFFKKYSALGFYKFMAFMGVKITYNHADYRALSSRAIKALLQFKERNLFLRALVPLLGFKTDRVEYDRLERYAGESKYPLAKMLSFAGNGITSFSIMPLRFVSMLGMVFFAMSLGLGVYALCVKFLSDGVVYGWTSTIVPLCFFSGVQLLSLGVIGEYIGKIYAETKERPRYFIEDIANPIKEA